MREGSGAAARQLETRQGSDSSKRAFARLNFMICCQVLTTVVVSRVHQNSECFDIRVEIGCVTNIISKHLRDIVFRTKKDALLGKTGHNTPRIQTNTWTPPKKMRFKYIRNNQ